MSGLVRGKRNGSLESLVALLHLHRERLGFHREGRCEDVEELA